MNKKSSSINLSRRDFLKIAGGTAFVAAGAGFMPQALRRVLRPEAVAQAQVEPDLYYAGTDGWIYLPPTPAIPPFHPDPLGPDPFNTYIFGFRNVTGMSDAQKINQKQKAQHNAPLFWVDQFNPSSPVDFRMQRMWSMCTWA
jgi:hypothetical protein